MARIIESLRIHNWPTSFAHSFSGLDILGDHPGVWMLIAIGEIKPDRLNQYRLQLRVERNDGMQSSQTIKSDKKTLETLKEALVENECIGWTWEDIGNLEVEFGKRY